MQRVLAERESGLLSLQGSAAFGHRPAAFAAAVLGDAGLARRLAPVALLPGHSGAVSALTWTEAGELLASGGEDCRLRLWRGATGELLHSLDTGHTATILSAAFLPGSRGDQLLCCSADRQIRHIAVTKGAVRPYLVHSGPVRSVTPLDAHVFLSASEDGTVREFDVRQRPVAVHRDALAGDDSNVLVDQRAERVGRSRVRVGIHSLAVDPLRPWLMLTGGTDPLLRLYDRRMLPEGDGKAPQWVSAYVPSHIKGAVLDSGRHPGLAGGGAGALPGQAVTAVAFARGGAQLVGSYSGECIYSFDAVQHARDVEALLHIPETVLRAPARPRSHMGRRSMRGLGASGSVEGGGQSPASQAGLAAIAAAAAAAAAAATVVEGAGGTTPAIPDAGVLRQQLQAQQVQRVRAARGIAIASSVRRLERQRRQQSRAAAAAEEPPRAESSRPAHWQMRPTSSTLRSPFQEQHAPQHAQHGHNHNLRHHTQQQAQQPPAHRQQPPQIQQQRSQQQQQQDARPTLHELPTDSEGPSDGVSPEGPHQRQAVRRSRRIMRRRRDAAEAAEQQHHSEGAGAAAGACQDALQQVEEQQGPLAAVQQPAVSGVAEPAAPASSSDSEDRELLSPATRGRRVRRRTLPPSAAADADAAPQPQQSCGAGVLPDVAEVAAAGGGDGGFKAPPGRSPQHPRRQAAAAAAAALQRLDSTLGLLHHHAPQLEASVVAAAPQQAQQEATVSMRAPDGPPAGARQRGAAPADRSLAAEVTSRPVPSASHAELPTQLESQRAGHEASSLNSAEPPANERVGSVVQRPQVDAPSVGNAPGTNAAAAAAAHGAPGEQQEVQQQVLQTQQTAEVQEASTGHPRGTRLLPPPPQFGAQLGAGPRQRQQLQPTASTGTSRPPAFGSQAQPGQRYLPPAASGRQASRLRRHSEGLDALQLAEAPGTAGYAAGSQAVADGTQAAAADAAEQQAGGRPPSAAAQLALSLQQAQPQATMLSGRGPSVLGDFMPGQQEQLADSEIAQQQLQQGSVGAQRGEGGGAAEPRAGQQQAAGQLRPGRRRQVDSNVGAIVNSTDVDDGEEVSEPTMFLRRYAGHLNLSATAPHDGPPLAPQLAFLGHHSELLVSPSDCGSLFIWDYKSATVVAVLPPHAPAASSSGSGGGELTPAPAAAATCVAPHPLLPVLAGGGADSVVRLWSPEAADACGRELAAAAVGANLQALAEAGGVGSDSGGAADRLAEDPSALFLPGSPCAFQ